MSQRDHWVTPAEQYLRMLWAARWLYLAITALFVVGAIVVTALLPRTYQTRAMLSVQGALSVEPTGMLYDGVLTAGQGIGRHTIVPTRFVERVKANRTVTLAARDAGVIKPTATIDPGKLRKWLAVDHLAGTDLIAVEVQQPTAQLANRFAQRLLARAIELSREEGRAEIAETRRSLTEELAKATAALQAAEERTIAGKGQGQGAELEVRAGRASLELSLARDTYAALRKRLSALDLMLMEQQPTLRVMDPPSWPIRPIYPRPLFNVAIGLILGVLVSTLVVIFRSVFAVGRAEAGTSPAAASMPAGVPLSR